MCYIVTISIPATCLPMGHEHGQYKTPDKTIVFRCFSTSTLLRKFNKIKLVQCKTQLLNVKYQFFFKSKVFVPKCFFELRKASLSRWRSSKFVGLYWLKRPTQLFTPLLSDLKWLKPYKGKPTITVQNWHFKRFAQITF